MRTLRKLSRAVECQGKRLNHLPCGVATIHAQVAASHKAASIAEQEDGGATVLLRTGEAAKHVLLGPLVAALGEFNEEILDHGGDDVAGGDGVDADVVGAPFGGEVAGKLEDSGFAGVVRGADETLYELLDHCTQREEQMCHGMKMMPRKR
jgi:hypothetical protein